MASNAEYNAQNIINQALQKAFTDHYQPKPRTGLLDFVRGDYAGDLATGLLANSGYSTMPSNLGSSVGQAMQFADKQQLNRDATALNEISALSNMSNALTKIAQTDRRIALTDRGLDQTDEKIGIQKESVEIQGGRLDLDKEKFAWKKDNPDAVSVLGGLKKDYNNGIISLDEYNKGIASATGIKDTATIQTIKWLADTNFDGDIVKATDKYFNSKTKDKGTFKRETIASLIDNPQFEPTEVFEMAEYIANQSYAEPLPVKDGQVDMTKLVVGNYYLHPNHGLVQAKLINGNIVPQQVKVPLAMQVKN